MNKAYDNLKSLHKGLNFYNSHESLMLNNLELWFRWKKYRKKVFNSYNGDSFIFGGEMTPIEEARLACEIFEDHTIFYNRFFELRVNTDQYQTFRTWALKRYQNDTVPQWITKQYSEPDDKPISVTDWLEAHSE